MIRNENGRPTEAGTPDAATERVSAPPTAYPQSNWHALPRGATPFAEVTYIDARDWMTEPQDMGDALALDTAVVSYRFRWYWSLGGDAA